MRVVLIALVAGLSACSEVKETAEPGGGLTVRTATRPLPPDGDSVALSADPAPFGGACLAGDPALGTRWTLEGLVAGVQTFPVTPIEEMSSRDSARLAARLARVADAIPSDTAGGDFRGLTMVVQAAWLVILAPEETLFAVRSVRRLPIESAPFEETTRFLARPTVQPGAREPLRVLWSVREVGPEESADPSDLVAALLVRAQPGLLFVREAVDTTAAELLLRQDSTWSLGWRGGVSRCPAR